MSANLQRKKDLLIHVANLIELHSLNSKAGQEEIRQAVGVFTKNLVLLLEDGLIYKEPVVTVAAENDIKETPPANEQPEKGYFGYFSSWSSASTTTSEVKPEEQVTKLSLFEMMKVSISANDPALWEAIVASGIDVGGGYSFSSITSNFSAASKDAADAKRISMIVNECLSQQMLGSTLKAFLAHSQIQVQYKGTAFIRLSTNQKSMLVILDGLKTVKFDFPTEDTSAPASSLPTIPNLGLGLFGSRILQGGGAALSTAYNASSRLIVSEATAEKQPDSPTNAEVEQIRELLKEANTTIGTLESHISKITGQINELKTEKMEIQLEIVAARKETEAAKAQHEKEIEKVKREARVEAAKEAAKELETAKKLIEQQVRASIEAEAEAANALQEKEKIATRARTSISRERKRTSASESKVNVSRVPSPPVSAFEE